MTFGPENKEEQLEDWPNVSLLLAARNEEALILRSLKAIDQLDYPKEKIQVLIGDDQSTDNTSKLVQEFIADKKNFTLLKIPGNMGKGRGKANVLAHLAHLATGDFFFITDVDVKLPQNWIKAMLAQFKPEVGIVSGTTMCERGKWFARMQSIDWLHFMGYIKSFAKMNVSCTSVGNNMAVRAQAYWETGGYENIDFSITEDYKLFEEVTSRGWGWANSLKPDTLGLAWYIPELSELLHQRKRWLIGAKDLPMLWKTLIVIYGLFIPSLLILFFINVKWALAVWLIKFLFQSLFIFTLASKAQIKPFSMLDLMAYEFYVLFTTVLSAVFYAMPIKSVWKGRVYNKEYLGG